VVLFPSRIHGLGIKKEKNLKIKLLIIKHFLKIRQVMITDGTIMCGGALVDKSVIFC
jgi:hypothetical protein